MMGTAPVEKRQLPGSPAVQIRKQRPKQRLKLWSKRRPMRHGGGKRWVRRSQSSSKALMGGPCQQEKAWTLQSSAAWAQYVPSHALQLCTVWNPGHSSGYAEGMEGVPADRVVAGGMIYHRRESAPSGSWW